MGGGGSFLYALRHPEMFSSSCPLSGDMGELSYSEFYKQKERKVWKISKRKKSLITTLTIMRFL